MAQIKIRHVHRPAAGCQDCLKIGGEWVHLRECLTCGHVACCDSPWVVTGVSQAPLLPPWAALALSIGLVLAAWRREGR